MTIDEAIEERQKVIEVQEKLYEEASTNESKEIIKSAIDNDRQLAEWLKELKELQEQNVELKSILNAALKDIHGKNILEVMNACRLCAMKFQQLCDIFPWQPANEALKVIGETNDEP